MYGRLQKARIEAIKRNTAQTITVGVTSSGYSPSRSVTVTLSPLSMVSSATYDDDGSDATTSTPIIVSYPNPYGGKTLSLVISLAGGVSIQ